MIDPWREMTDDEVADLRPYMIDADGLSDADCAILRKVAAATLAELVAMMCSRGLVPTEEDERSLTRAVVAQINDQIVPAMRQRATGLN